MTKEEVIDQFIQFVADAGGEEDFRQARYWGLTFIADCEENSNNVIHDVSLSDYVNSNHNEAKSKYEEHEKESDYEAQYWWGRLIAFGAMKKFIKEFHSS